MLLLVDCLDQQLEACVDRAEALRMIEWDYDSGHVFFTVDMKGTVSPLGKPGQPPEPAGGMTDGCRDTVLQVVEKYQRLLSLQVGLGADELVKTWQRLRV